MKPHVPILTFVAAVLMTAWPGRAAAAPVRLIEGTISAWALAPHPTDATREQLSITAAQTTRIDGVAVGPYPTTFNPSFDINRTPVAGPPGFTAFQVINAPQLFPYQKRIMQLPGQDPAVPGNATFRPINLTILVPVAAANTLSVQGPETPGFNSSTYDFSQINSLTINLTAGAGVNLANVIRNGGNANGTAGSFTQTAPVPEPASLILLAGEIGAAGLWLLHRTGAGARDRSASFTPGPTA